MNKSVIGIAVLLAGTAGVAQWLLLAKSTPVPMTARSEEARSAPSTSRDQQWTRNGTDSADRLGGRHIVAFIENPSPTAIASATIAEGSSSEDEQIATFDNHPRQRVWRERFGSEHQDEAWTELMLQRLREKAAEVLDNHEISLWDLSCRRTICRMYLKFDDQLDAQAFQVAFVEPTHEYEFQSLDPEFKGVGFDRSEYTYEVMIQRAPGDVDSPNGVDATTEANQDGENGAVGVAVADTEEVTVLNGNVN